MVVHFVIMQKIINALAVASFVVSGAVVVAGTYVYVNKDAIVENVKEEAIAAVTELLGTSQLGSTLIEGVAPDVDVTDEALGADTAVPLPVDPF